jgi:hypothetical protein
MSELVNQRISECRRGIPALCAVLALAMPVEATTYYVDVTNGNNSWSGTNATVMGGTNGVHFGLGMNCGFQVVSGTAVYAQVYAP